jgi:hypothetical protein
MDDADGVEMKDRPARERRAAFCVSLPSLAAPRPAVPRHTTPYLAMPKMPFGGSFYI